MSQGFEPVELLDGTAVVAFGLGLIAENQGPSVGLFHQVVESFCQRVVVVLGGGDFNFPLTGEFWGHEDHRSDAGVEGLVEAGGEEPGFQARGAEDGLLGEGEALDGEEFLGVDGLVDGDEVGPEVGDLIEVFEADDGKGGGGEAVFAGILCGAGFALGGTRSGRLGGVGAIGSELFFGDGFSGAWHALDLLFGDIARESGQACRADPSSIRGGRVYFVGLVVIVGARWGENQRCERGHRAWRCGAERAGVLDARKRKRTGGAFPVRVADSRGVVTRIPKRSSDHAGSNPAAAVPF